MTERRRPLDNDDGQESLFGGDAFAAGAPAPTAWEREHASSPSAATPHMLGEGPTPRLPLEAAEAPGTEEHAPFDEGQYLTGYEAGPSVEDFAAYDVEVGALPTEVPAHDAGDELAALERATLDTRAPLVGPTLDDVMSRAWEGLVTGLPAACPVCDGEVVPSVAGSVHGTCSSCGTTIE